MSCDYPMWHANGHGDVDVVIRILDDYFNSHDSEAIYKMESEWHNDDYYEKLYYNKG